jgi:hypothetical protein
LTPHFDALNALDGWSTTADITVRFSAAIDAATLAENVRVIRVAIDNATKATVGVLGILIPGVDYSIGVSPDMDSGGATLLIRPLKPLVPSTGGTNNGYLVLVTDGVTDTSGNAATADAEYLTVRTAAIADLTGGVNPPTCTSITNVTLNGVCRLTFAHLAIGSQLPGGLAVAPTDVVASFSFSTVATQDTLAYLALTTAPRPYAVAATGLNTSFMGLPGIADIYAGSLNIQYRLAVPDSANSTNILTTSWQAAGAVSSAGPRSGEPELDAIQPGARGRHGARHPPAPDGAKRHSKTPRWMAGCHFSCTASPAIARMRCWSQTRWPREGWRQLRSTCRCTASRLLRRPMRNTLRPRSSAPSISICKSTGSSAYRAGWRGGSHRRQFPQSHERAGSAR